MICETGIGPWDIGNRIWAPADCTLKIAWEPTKEVHRRDGKILSKDDSTGQSWVCEKRVKLILFQVPQDFSVLQKALTID